MSYCRFSSDEFRSDVYVYEGMDSYNIHVSTCRYVFEPEHPFPKFPMNSIDQASLDQYMVDRIRALDNVEIVSYGDLPDAGEVFTYGDIESCLAKLEDLRHKGYHIPQCAICSLMEELEEENKLTEEE